jgi:hypothetical protein
MQFLSIAERELRVAARKRSTFRLRVLVALAAVVASALAFWGISLFGATARTGETLFDLLTIILFAAACAAGPLLTADCISEEKRNDTLGLLFLTRLNSASLVLGKLAANGLIALYSMVALIPVIALPVLLGGTDLLTVLDRALNSLMTLTVSLLLGMAVSTIVKKAWTSSGITLLLVGAVAIAVPLTAEMLRRNGYTNWALWISLLDPDGVVSLSPISWYSPTRGEAVLHLVAQLSGALVLFGLITFLIARFWREGKSTLTERWRTRRRFPAFQKCHAALRTRLLALNPVLWLSSRQLFGPANYAIVMFILASTVTWAANHVRFGPILPDEFLRPLVVWAWAIPLLYLSFCFRLAAAPADRIISDRKSAAFELLVCTALSTREIVRGYWLATIRRFWGAAALILLLHAFVLYYITEAIRIAGPQKDFTLLSAVAASLRHVLRIQSISNDAIFYIVTLAIFTAAFLIVVLWIALGWLSLALSLKLRRELFVPWCALLLLAAPPIPIFLALASLIVSTKFSDNQFSQMLSLGMTGFFVVLGNALLWLFLARRWTYRLIRPTLRDHKEVRSGAEEGASPRGC